MRGTAAPGFAPIFDWSETSRGKFPLVGFLAASAVLHAACFYLFQIVYPVTAALTPPPARVDLITPDSEEGRVLLRWLEAEDPALSSTTVRPTDALASLPPEPTHVPSYLREQPALKKLPPLPPDLRIPSAQPPGPVRLPRATASAPASPTRTQVRIADPADSLGEPALPPLRFAASVEGPPAAAQFRIAIDPAGAVQHCFLASSSGDRALDEQARQALLLCRFPAIRQTPGHGAPRWTTAIFEWGNDIATPGHSSPAPPAP